MDINFRSVGFSLTDEDREFLDKKLKKLSFAEEYLLSIEVIAKKEAKGIGFSLEAILAFSWHKEKVVKNDSYELYEGIEKLCDMIQAAAKKEKEKIKG